MPMHGSSRSVVAGLSLLGVGALVSVVVGVVVSAGCWPSAKQSKASPSASSERAGEVAQAATKSSPPLVAKAVEKEPERAPNTEPEPAAEPSEGSLPPVDEVEAKKLADALRSVDEGSAARAAAAGLAELEAERMPSYLTTALKDYATAAPEQRSMVVSREIGTEDGQRAWESACAGGIVVFQKVAVAAPEAKAGILFERCKLGRFGLFDAEAAAGADPSALLLATMAAQHLQSNNSLSEDEGYAISKLTAPVDDGADKSGDR